MTRILYAVGAALVLLSLGATECEKRHIYVPEASTLAYEVQPGRMLPGFTVPDDTCTQVFAAVARSLRACHTEAACGNFEHLLTHEPMCCSDLASELPPNTQNPCEDT
jgi:hypothetical protein